MKMHTLPKIVAKNNRRMGRGGGSGRGKTAGRGTKGQNAKEKVPTRFEGGQLPLVKRLPFKRGRSRNRSFQTKPYPVNVGDLNVFTAGATVTVELLVQKELVTKDATVRGVKILGDGTLEKKLTVSLPCSQSAKIKIEKAGGSVESKKTVQSNTAKKTKSTK